QDRAGAGPGQAPVREAPGPGRTRAPAGDRTGPGPPRPPVSRGRLGCADARILVGQHELNMGVNWLRLGWLPPGGSGPRSPDASLKAGKEINANTQLALAA